MKRSLRLFGLLGAALGTLSMTDRARACGCFTPPDPAVPIVQAGERIVFAVSNSQVVAHIQIQYAGDAKDFGWLLPLPSVPTLELGTEELFTQLINQTQPKYRLKIGNTCGTARGPVAFGAAGASNSAGPEDKNAMGDPSPLVIQDSIGPYDYAVLKADSQDAMLQWLQTNHYFVPTGTATAVSAYIHPGAFFLALRLHSGNSAGDLQPVVVRYASDLPMIPIVLTSTTAQPDMGIQVWMLGPGRAIPRNYFHTVIDEAAINWQTAGANYRDVIVRATKEAKERHTFVTEFAGKSDVMKNILDRPGRFANQDLLRRTSDPIQYVQLLVQDGFNTLTPTQMGGFIGPTQVLFGGTLLAILEKYIPMPQALIDQKLPPAQYYAQLSFYLGQYRQMNPSQFAGLDFNYDPVKLTDEIWMRVVQPTLAAAQLFTSYPYLTRLFTTLSPENMTKDPVFSYNPDLPDVNNVHQATENFVCDWLGKTQSAIIQTDSGFVISLPDGNTPSVSIDSLPASQRIEVLREQGQPEVVTDNTGGIMSALGQTGGGCNVDPGAAPSRSGAGLALLAAAAMMLARRRRPESSN